VAITGPTVSTLTDGPDGTKAARVTIPTQAGDLRITVTVDDANGEKRWVVDTPLPTLDLSEVQNIAPPTTATPRTSTPSTTTATDTTQPIPTSSPSTTPQPTVDLDEPTTAASRGNDPTPVPGTIPIPELDTPIPGGR
jgi:hypothetical protein